MHLELRHLRTIKAIHDTGGLARAADILNITQSALSHQIKGLEDQAGVELFVRRTRPMRLSAAGLRMLRAAERILPELEALSDEFRALRSGRSGRLFIAMECHACFDWLFPVLEQFRHAWPDVDVDIRAGLAFDALDARALAEIEPVLDGFAGAILLRDPAACSDPGGLTAAYASLFARNGGRLFSGDARSLSQTPHGWSVATDAGIVEAREAVIALGPWSDDVFKPLGYRIPLGVKRGYHMHYRAAGESVLNHPVLDVDGGYLVAPMAQGLRLTTGAEFARRDAPPSPVQLTAVEPLARKTFRLGERIDAEPWLGRRPCLPDLLPVIGPAPRHPGLWFDFGHQHHGFTLGPIAGRLLAELMTGEAPFADAAPFSAERF